ncbi:MAG: glucose 1-dehydrogenase [Gammaproteobacteria bacterium]|nr:glucose 1-dehydrogenase [Gammaproteobacteria bacterium]
MRGLNGKVAVVTGAGSGLGRGIALRLASEQVTIVVLDVDEAGAGLTVSMIKEQTGEALSIPTDICDYLACRVAVDQVIDQYGSIDILVNNAGWDKAMPFIDTDPELWQKIVNINLFGPLNMHHVVVPHMVEAGGGKIVNIASDAGRVGSSSEAVYSACKGGIVAFSKTLCREVARKGVLINNVCPGPSDTPLFAAFAGEGEKAEKLRAGLERAIPLHRLGTAQDIAGIVTFLASEEANFIVGQTISVSGGLTMHG